MICCLFCLSVWRHVILRIISRFNYLTLFNLSVPVFGVKVQDQLIFSVDAGEADLDSHGFLNIKAFSADDLWLISDLSEMIKINVLRLGVSWLQLVARFSNSFVQVRHTGKV